MALRQLMQDKDLKTATSAAETHRQARAAFETRAEKIKARELRAEEAIGELNDSSTEEEREAVKKEVEEIEAEQAALDKDIAEHDAKQIDLDKAAADIQKDIDELAERSKNQSKPNQREQHNNPPPAENRGRKEQSMNTRDKIFGSMERRDAFFARAEVKDFIEEIRASIKGEKRSVSGTALTIPEVMLEVLRDNMTQFSKLLKHVSLKSIKGKARQIVMGDIPEGVWIEAVGKLNELDLALNQVEVDGYLVGGFIPIANSYLEDSDMNLGTEIMMVLGKAIGKGLDRAILFGTGVKMPLGIITRLKQTSAPSDYSENARAWVDLHTTNILKINVSASTGAAFFVSLIQSLGVAKPEYSDGVPVWIMNRKTHMDIKAKALAFNIPALVSAGDNTLPVVGGVVEELEMLGDNEIVGGFGTLYLMVEREGQKFESSEHVKFLENVTIYKGYARYDGEPVIPEGFVMVSYDNTDAATSSTFPTDYANTDLGVLSVTAAAGTASGDTVLTVTGTESSGTTLKYKKGDFNVATGDTPVGYTALTSGTTQVTAAAGTAITVVELNSVGRVIKAGKVVAVPKA